MGKGKSKTGERQERRDLETAVYVPPKHDLTVQLRAPRQAVEVSWSNLKLAIARNGKRLGVQGVSAIYNDLERIRKTMDATTAFLEGKGDTA